MDEKIGLFDIRKGMMLAFEQGSLEEFIADACQRMEKIVARFVSKSRVTERTSAPVILYRGKLRRLIDPDPKRGKLRSSYAVFALQWLYILQDAMAKSNTARAVEAMMGFIAFNMEVANYDQYGTYVFEALIRTAKRKAGSRKGGEATAKWTPAIDALARRIFSDQKRARIKDTPAYQRTASKLFSDHGHEVSAATMRRHLGNFNAQR